MKHKVMTSALLVALTYGAHAQWSTLNLPATSGGSTTLSHLDDGRFVYGDGNDIWVQDTFGAQGQTQHAASIPGFGFPSFMDVRSDNSAVVGDGGSGIHGFDASVMTNGAMVAIGSTAQDFAGVLRDDNNLYLAGGNGTTPNAFGNYNALSLVNLGSGVATLLIDDISEFSAGIDIDSAGNVYVANNDNGVVRSFTPAQLGAGGLSYGDGTFIHDFGDGGHVGSIAVDSQGRVFAGGFLQTGFQGYDPNLGETRVFEPAFANQSYILETFSAGGNDYVAFSNPETGFSAGSDAVYGFANVNAIAVPEPSSMALFLFGPLLIWAYRRAMLLHLA